MKSWYMRVLLLALVGALAFGTIAVAQEAQPTTDPAAATAAAPEHHSEADLILPDLGSVQFLGMGGDTLLTWGLVIALALGVGGAIGLGLGLGGFVLPRCERLASQVALIGGGAVAVGLGLLIGFRQLVG